MNLEVTGGLDRTPTFGEGEQSADPILGPGDCGSLDLSGARGLELETTDAKPSDGLRRPASEIGVVGMLDGLGDRGSFDTEVLELGVGRREVPLGVSQMLLVCIARFRRCCRGAVNVDIVL